MVRQQIGFLMIVLAATIGVIALSAITDTIRQWKTLDVEKALSMFKNPQQAAHLAWLLENKKNNRS